MPKALETGDMCEMGVNRAAGRIATQVVMTLKGRVSRRVAHGSNKALSHA